MNDELSNTVNLRNFVGRRISSEPWWSKKREQWAVTIVDGWETRTHFFADLDAAAIFIVMHPFYRRKSE